MTTRAYVWSDLGGTPVVVGRMDLLDERRAEFVYAQSYLERRDTRPLDPRHLPLSSADTLPAARTLPIAPLHNTLQGVIGDAAPDGWGQRVLLHLFPRSIKTPFDAQLRMEGHGAGSLLFSGSATQCKPRAAAPALDQLGAALEGAEAVQLGKPIRLAVRDLMTAGTSLGVVRPKIAACDEKGRHWIAKFPKHDDTADLPRLEVATMKLARSCSIDACEARFVALGTRSVALVRRFDRLPQGRTAHYASAHGLWNRSSASEQSTQDWASYGGIADLVRQIVVAAHIKDTLQELFRRMLFNVLIGNTDDHGKNHGFLMDEQGRWTLAPAFDLLPTLGADTRYQSLGIGPAGRERNLANALAGAGRMGISKAVAQTLFADMRQKLRSHWQRRMKAEGVSVADNAVARGRWLPELAL
ncbi:MAG: type II toxin-antitoxin system HipA family toxin [Panacagrimonas sp.]